MTCSRKHSTQSALTRRQFLTATSSLLGASTLAACAGEPSATMQATAVRTTTSTSNGETRVVEHLMGAVEIPANPQRVVTLHDLSLTTMALHLGFQPIGSHGRIGANGEETFTLGEGLSAAGLTHVGAFNAINFERLLTLEPDLIIGRSLEAPVYEELSAIAPTVLAPNEVSLDSIAFSAFVADLLNRTQRHEEFLALYEQKIALIKALVPNPQEVYVTHLFMFDAEGTILMQGGTSPIDQVIRDVGFSKREAVREMENDYTPGATGDNFYRLSLEVVPDLDADFVFNNYFKQGNNLTLDSSRDIENGPIWQQMYAVQQNQYINSNGGPVGGNGLFFLLNAADLIRAHIGERGFVTRAGGWD
ncbi:MAG: ABC transporter substrate-binding protein [Chloroflexales bacterium]|nr:ABC transporter substrate-binding protein [Chloroflexales bacterium]